jgi:hypothetical protein
VFLGVHGLPRWSRLALVALSLAVLPDGRVVPDLAYGASAVLVTAGLLALAVWALRRLDRPAAALAGRH